MDKLRLQAELAEVAVDLKTVSIAATAQRHRTAELEQEILSTNITPSTKALIETSLFSLDRLCGKILGIWTQVKEIQAELDQESLESDSSYTEQKRAAVDSPAK